MAAERHRLLLSLRWLLPAAAVMAMALAVLTHSRFAHVAGLSLAFTLGVLAIVQKRVQPVLLLDDEGYGIEQGGKLRFKVPWREVVKVRADVKEKALYIDCGDRARNLLVPPARGYGFRFAEPGRIYARVVAAVGDRVVQVERLDDNS